MSSNQKLSDVRNRARRLGIRGKIDYSTNKDKKFMITKSNGEVIHFGQTGYGDYLDHRDEKRRKAFHARFGNNVGYDNRGSGLFYSSRLLW